MLGANWKSKKFLLFILFLQFMFYTAVLFDISIARQVSGFLYLTFLPGLVILKLLKLKELSWVEVFTLSVGLSIAFLMLVGLFVNEIYFFLGMPEPLSLIPLMIILNGLIFVGGVFVHLRSADIKFWADSQRASKCFPWSMIVFVCLPILSVVGAMLVNCHGNNLILLIMILAITLLFAIAVNSKKLGSQKLYTIAILMIGVSLLYHSSLISNYIVTFGSDSSIEYFVFKTTENAARWCPDIPLRLEYGRINAMLSVTILPTIYSILLNIDPTMIFKLIFPLIFSFVPLVLYQIWQIYIEKKYAFIAAFLFMAQETFYTEMLGLNRQMIGELFFVLLLFLVLSNKLKHHSKILLFMLFSFGLVTSHYGIALIFLFFIVFAYAFLFLSRQQNKKITITLIALFFVMMFSWYIFTSGGHVFDSVLESGDHVYRQLSDFFNPKARGETVLRGLGLENPPTVWNMISRVFAYATQFFIVVGFIGLVTKRVKKPAKEYFAFSFSAMAFLAALILVPGLANTLNMTRFYHILLFFLAPLCVIGVEVIVKLAFKREKDIAVSLLLLIILVPYFLFQTNFVYELVGAQSYSLPLSKHRMDAVFLRWYMGYFDESEVFGAFWISRNINTKESKIYADISSAYALLNGYGMIYSDYLVVLSNVSELSKDDTLYLNRANVVDGIVLGSRSWNTTSISYIWNYADKIYSNGECEIFREKFGK